MTTSSLVGPLIKERKEENQDNADINVGLVVAAKDRDMEDKTREGRSRITMK